MSFGIRELLMLIGALIFVGVLVDGIRRFQNNRKSQIKVTVDRKAQNELADEGDPDDWYPSELPSGGARVLGQKQANKTEQKIMPRFSEPEDVLMSGLNKHASVVSEKINLEYELEVEHAADDKQGSEAETNEIERTKSSIKATAQYSQSTKQESDKKAQTKKEQRDLFTANEPEQSNEEATVTIQKEQNDLPEEVLSINVIAKGDREINGDQLLEAVLTFGLRFGEMDIFHRHEHSNGQGNVIFSMASAINPGTFDIESLPDTSLKGVTFFMRLSQLNKRMFVLELMLDIAKRLANQLDAELKDDAHSVLSSQTVTHYKSRIQEYERKHLGRVLRN